MTSSLFAHMDRLKTIVTYRDLPLAELAKCTLESEDIPCFLANKNLVGVNWLYSFAVGGVNVQVCMKDTEEAIKILNKDSSPKLSIVERDLSAIEQKDLCTQCSSQNIIVVRASRKAGALSLLFGLPIICFRKRYQCNDCGHIMKPGRT